MVKKVQVVLLLLLAVSLIVFMDLTHNYFNATFIELHDGSIEIKGFFSRMLYGDDGWSLIKFYNGFIISLRIVILLGVTNIIFACITVWKKN
jgi:hypothetical protein